MIESVMFFALGFVAATLIALVFIPAINSRADRLARRRAAALFPLSVTELTAEKDHLRAEFAVLQRKLERRAEEALGYKHQAMEELGRRAVQINALETTLQERGRYLEGIEADLGTARQRVVQLEEEAASTKAILGATRETLAAVEDAHRRTLDELATSRRETDRVNTLLVGVRAELANAEDRLAVREAAYAALEAAHAAALTHIDTNRITISDLETRLATQTARAEDYERALGDRGGELGEERQRLAELARNLAAEQERGLLLDQRVRELERERDRKAEEADTLAARLAVQASPEGSAPAAPAGEDALLVAERKLQDARSRIAALEAGHDGASSAEDTELRSLSDRYEILKAERSALQGALSAAREEQARLSEELKALRARKDDSGGSEDLRAENAELRRRIDEVADEIMRSAGSEGTPAAATPSPHRRTRRKAPTPTS